MPTPNNVSGFGYSWGFTSTADLTKCEVETPSSLSYTLGNTVNIFIDNYFFNYEFFSYTIIYLSIFIIVVKN